MIDGRNRLAACKLAGVDPKEMNFEGDVNVFINSANNIRRELTKGQKAMSYAVMFPETENKGGRDKLSHDRDSLSKTEKNLIGQARTILKHKPELQGEVLSKAKGLNEAYELAKAAKQENKQLLAAAGERTERMNEPFK